MVVPRVRIFNTNRQAAKKSLLVKIGLMSNHIDGIKKAQNDVNRPKSGVVGRIGCTSCNFLHYRQTERAFETRIAEHKRAVAMFDHDSKVSCHVHDHG